EFLSHPKWKRLLVAVAGPVFNIATALAIPTIAILIGFQDSVFRAQDMVIGLVKSGSTAEAAGLKPGDRIVGYGDNQHPTWEDFFLDVRLRPNEELPLKIQRDGQILTQVVKLQAETMEREQVGTIGVEPSLASVKVAQVVKDSPAARAGMKAGDKIIAVDGEPVTAWNQFKDVLRRSEGRALTFRVERQGSVLEMQAAPEKDDRTSDYRLGFYPDL